jgi:hypothetical protein
MSRIKEWGFVYSHFIKDSGQFSILDSMTEKIDNSYSAGATKFIIKNIGKYILLIDNVGMEKDELEKYFNLYRDSKKNHYSNRKDNGVHGLGAKEADIILCNKFKTIVITKKNNDIIGKQINFKKMINDCNNNEKMPYTNNILDITDNHKNIFKTHMASENFKNGTIFIYEFNGSDFFNKARKRFNEIQYHFDDFGLIYHDYLIKEDIDIIFKKNNNTSYVKPFDFMYRDLLLNKYPELIDEDNNMLNHSEDFTIYKNIENDVYYLKLFNKIYILKSKLKEYKNFNENSRNIEKIIESSIELTYIVKLKNNIISNEENKYGYMGGCIIKRNGRAMTTRPIFPSRIRKNENLYLRAELNLLDTEYDSVLPTSINKSKFLLKPIIDHVLRITMHTFRKNFPTKHDIKHDIIKKKEQKTIFEIIEEPKEIKPKKIIEKSKKIIENPKEIKPKKIIEEPKKIVEEPTEIKPKKIIKESKKIIGPKKEKILIQNALNILYSYELKNNKNVLKAIQILEQKI